MQPTATLTNDASGVSSVSGQLGNVTVTDLRGSTAAWNAKASSTTFATGTGNPTSTGVTYSSGAITTTGTIVIVAQASPTALNGTPAKVAGPTSVVGNNTASWNPTLTVELPSDALAGNYSGTVNTSVL